MLEKITALLGEGLLVTVFCMAIVFTALIVLMYIIRIMAAALKDKVVKDTETHKTIDRQSYRQNDVAVSKAVNSEKTDDAEIVAAIMAAICAYTNMSNNEFTIKSIKRIDRGDSSWRKAGIL